MTARLQAWLRAFAPHPLGVSRRERVFGAVGAGVGLLFAAWISRRIAGGLDVWFIAPMGASAVLLFAVPASPLAQPWSVVGGNVVSAAVGVACARWLLPDVPLAAGVAVGLAIGAMFALRCLHPPGGAVALTAVFGGPAIATLGWHFVFWPVAVDSLLMVLAALLFNTAARRRYPHHPSVNANVHGTRDAPPRARLGLTADDLDAALRARGELLDVSRDDLVTLFAEAEQRAWRRRFGDIRCADVMSRDVVTVGPSTSPQRAWRLMVDHSVKALPVLDPDRVLLGIVTLHDFFVDHSPGAGAAPRRTVAEMMTQDVLATRPGSSLVELTSLFSDGGRHHLPVVDEQRRLVGMVTQSDMVAALFRAGLENAA